ncbi:MAG: nucleoside triphosphate pyrophosphohydrolase [Deltaproteobacteria bacterium]|nr:nucleoside triphosphate pyrophosphohydrolase [Deltaproteobacteria bacterium]
MTDAFGSPSAGFSRLVSIVARLRAPDGCPWDREQTPQSATPYLLEEAHEAAEAIDRGDPAVICEELGDLLLQVVFQTQLVADTTHAFTIEDVIAGIVEKLIRRHPHVFGDTKVTGTDEVLANWEKIKRSEKPHKVSMLDGIPKGLPALLRAYRLGQKASRVGFDWADANGILGKVEEEARELHAAQQQGDMDRVEAEFGDLLFTLANLGRFLKLDPEGALRRAADRFTTRFQWIETAARERGTPLEQLSPQAWDALWEEAKTCHPEK